MLRDIYRRLFDFFGPQHWWPADSPFEVCVGAILTQNTAWSNVERAISALKEEGMLSPREIAGCDRRRLAEMVRPSGFFNQKAERLQVFAVWLLERFGGDIRAAAGEPLEVVRREMLSLKGIGPETADSMLLYAAGVPVFVVDSYTRRILSRHGIAAYDTPYEVLRRMFEDAIPHDADVYGEYHALIVETAKTFCRKKAADCGSCPLADLRC